MLVSIVLKVVLGTTSRGITHAIMGNVGHEVQGSALEIIGSSTWGEGCGMLGDGY